MTHNFSFKTAIAIATLVITVRIVRIIKTVAGSMRRSYQCHSTNGSK